MKPLGTRARLGVILGTLLLGAAVAAPSSAQSPPLEIPFVDEWAASAHARRSAEAFNHWNEEGEIPKACARCHSTPGFRDYIGADASAAGVVDRPALVGSVIACVACHNDATRKMTAVTFPSGITMEGLGPEASCMSCHQGRESTVSVNKAMADLPADEVNEKLGFINIHYRAAAATRYGTDVKGGYEYDGMAYDGLYLHHKDSTVCADCHSPHTFRVEVASCDLCHRKTETAEDFVKVRRTEGDFDGDGNAEEGIAGEIATLHQKVYGAIQSYAKTVAGTPVVYEAHNYPYFFTDKNGNGKVDAGEAIYPNRYKAWTPRLLKAAFNYQFVAKDPGAYTHNPMYAIQLLHDSLADLASRVAIDMEGVSRPQP